MNHRADYPDLESILSTARFGTYVAWAASDRERAVALYTLNAQLSECFYLPLQMLEVALRNRIDSVLRDVAGETWFDRAEYHANPRQPDMLAKARQDLTDARKDPTPGAIVAALTFGFWTAMLGKEYENIWQTDLHRIARRADGKGLRRKDFTRPLGPLRLLRNRVAHHEPILHWDLRKHHAALLELTGWLSPVAADWCRDQSRFAAVYPAEGIGLAVIDAKREQA